MRPIRYGDGTRWNDKNARWGNPSYIIEPGEDGYQLPTPPPAPSTTKPNKNMSSNSTPDKRTVLTSLARQIHQGQLNHQTSVGLHHHQAAGMNTLILKLTGDPTAPDGSAANKGSQLLYRACIDATAAAVTALTTLSDTTAKEWLEGYKRVLEGILGKTAGNPWLTAGFPLGKPAIPRNHTQRHTLIEAARAYLTANPGYQTSLPRKDLPPLEITAAAALALHTQMQAAFTLINTREAEQALCKAARDEDVENLYQEVSATIAELRDLLSDDDPRWELFGLNIPANPSPPQGVATLTLTPAGPGRVLAEWAYAVRAEYYRLFLQIVGTDPDFNNIADPRDLEYTIKDLPPGTLIRVKVTPANEGGEGPSSPIVEYTVPA